MAHTPRQDTRFFEDICPETSIRIQDEMMVEWLQGLRFRQQTPRVVPAWLSKQFAQKKELHSDQTQKQPMPFPMVSLSVGAIEPDTSRRQFNNILTQNGRGRIFADQDKEFLYEVPWPLPIRIPYQIDVYTKTRQDHRMLETAILARFAFSDMMYLKARFPGYGEILLRLALNRIDDTSELETGEKERELRFTVSTTLDGWIFRVPIKRRTIKKGHVVFIDAGSQTQGNPNEGNLLQDQAFMNWYNDPDHYNFGANFATITAVEEDPDHTPPDRVLSWLSFDSSGLVDVGP